MKAKVTFTILFLLALVGASFGQTPGSVRFPTNLDTSVSLLEVQDRASTTLNGTITSGATTITVVSTSLFPATGTLTIDDERLYYTAKTSTTFTVVRGQFSSTAAAHSSGAAVRMNVMAIHHTAVRDSLIAVQTKLGSTASTPTTTGHVLTVTGAGTTTWQAPSVSSILPVADTQTVVKGSADATKLIRFEVDGLTTATTRVLTVPDADLTLVGLATTQSLTNKTIAGATNTITPIDTNFTITGSADLTKIARFEVDGFTTATTRVLTVPDANIVVAGSAAALTSGRVPFVTTGGLLTDSAGLTYNGTTFSLISTTLNPAGAPMDFQYNGSQTLWNDFGAFRMVNTNSTNNNYTGINFSSSTLSIAAGIAAVNVNQASSYADLVFSVRGTPGFTGNALRIFSDTAVSINSATNAAQLFINNRTAAQIGAIIKGAASQSANLLELQNSSATILTAFNSAGAISTFAGFADAVNIAVGTTTGTRIGTATSQKIGIWNATPIVQPSSTGQTAGFTAGAGTAVLSDSTFTGGLGSTAYTIGDIVRHLKSFGLIAQ